MQRQLTPGALVLGFAILLLGGPPTEALRPPSEDGGPPDPSPRVLHCLSDTTASFSATPATVELGQSATLHWHVSVPSGCGGLQVYLGPEHVERTGSRTVQAVALGMSYSLRATFAGASRSLASTALQVTLPPIGDRVTISANYMVPLFLAAIQKPNTIIDIQNHVELDLSGQDFLHIAPGVKILGGRTTKEPGPRLFTTTFPERLFMIGVYDNADYVQITGLRLEGAETGIADGDAVGSVGISVFSSVNVEIAHNEISRWRGTAVSVLDPRRRLSRTNPQAVWVHDNFIHHNLHYGREGYGVAMYQSAHVLIEKNVFDYNRHAISAEGSDGTGYSAQRNLVLEHGGLNSGFPFYTHTHQFDVHGTEDCWGFEKYCGQAGEYFDISYNTILYTAGTAIKVRGEPTIRADVAHNVFAHSQVWGGYLDDAALVQIEGDNLKAWNNTFGLNAMETFGMCDFDGDGLDDLFFASGVTWWVMMNGGTGLAYLNTSPKRLHEVTLGDVTGDGRCDVVADRIVYPGGKAW